MAKDLNKEIMGFRERIAFGLQTVVNKIANKQAEKRTAFNVAQINYIFFETERRYNPRMTKLK